jgi:hypothetical protein
MCVHNGEVACNLTTCVYKQICILRSRRKNLPLADEINSLVVVDAFWYESESGKAFCFMFFVFLWINCLHGYIYEAFILKNGGWGVEGRWKRGSCCKISGFYELCQDYKFIYVSCEMKRRHKYCVKNFLYWIKIPFPFIIVEIIW